ncbi:MAG TPA: hypothetical protein DF383_09380 [Deltaproteobacteria bacterium]|nr:hypothetical protein [Deltaproteobacteria bacterium]
MKKNQRQEALDRAKLSWQKVKASLKKWKEETAQSPWWKKYPAALSRPFVTQARALFPKVQEAFQQWKNEIAQSPWWKKLPVAVYQIAKWPLLPFNFNLLSGGEWGLVLKKESGTEKQIAKIKEQLRTLEKLPPEKPTKLGKIWNRVTWPLRRLRKKQSAEQLQKELAALQGPQQRWGARISQKMRLPLIGKVLLSFLMTYKLADWISPPYTYDPKRDGEQSNGDAKFGPTRKITMPDPTLRGEPNQKDPPKR